MTQEEVIKDLKEILARDIGYTTWTISTPHLVFLVNKAIEAEREACAAICDEVSKDMSIGPLEKYRASWIAQAIRARAKQ
jgi:hypothetical protein